MGQFEKALEELERADAWLEKMEDYVPPEDIKKAKDWIFNDSLNGLTAQAVNLAYGEDARKKDRQKIIKISDALAVLATLEDSIVKDGGVLGPLKIADKQLSSTFITAAAVLQGTWEGIKFVYKAGWGNAWEAFQVAILHLITLWTVSTVKDQLQSALGHAEAAVKAMRDQALPQPPSGRVWLRARHRRV